MKCTNIFVLMILGPTFGVCLSPIKENLLPNTTICGIHNVVDQVIFNGNETKLEEFPWMALLEYKEKMSKGKKREHLCGGALINDRYVLTAAHCLHHKNYTLVGVRLGEFNKTSKKDCVDGKCAPKVLKIRIEEKIVHENYSASDENRCNDVALLRLERNVPFSDFVTPICLPVTKDLQDWSYDESELVISGWGYAEEQETSDVKLKVKLPIVDHLSCAKAYRDFQIALNSHQMCVGGTLGKDLCTRIGDSGGPSMAQHFDEKQSLNWYAVGILSFGPHPCTKAEVPGAYTRVSSYVDWIVSKLKA